MFIFHCPHVAQKVTTEVSKKVGMVFASETVYFTEHNKPSKKLCRDFKPMYSLACCCLQLPLFLLLNYNAAMYAVSVSLVVSPHSTQDSFQFITYPTL